GVTSTAVGVAVAGARAAATRAADAEAGRTVLLTGDVAFLHDANGLLGAAGRGIDLTVVVVDNDGGGIFSFLPQATELADERFEQLFGTPHGVDLPMLAAAHGLISLEPSAAADVGPTIAAAVRSGGVRLVRVRTERASNVAVHDELHAAVVAALG
ncbi:MAG: 2-succinyl-5-enolpyruvyl-6-hydroxy-3-cyclohexene-carboxylic-acid synthase, partial [Acidimicrobiales bacterium]|nr:2-succinyl-5-enolpyruvyl-6-hydroxy-3-cyclohexene-carboxylic-acid synthase [Acidimicrobiales bacterium]